MYPGTHFEPRNHGKSLFFARYHVGIYGFSHPQESLETSVSLILCQLAFSFDGLLNHLHKLLVNYHGRLEDPNFQ